MNGFDTTQAAINTSMPDGVIGKNVVFNGSDEFLSKLKSFNLDEKEFIAPYNGEGVACFEFDESPRISTYLYCFIAGPYVAFESD